MESKMDILAKLAKKVMHKDDSQIKSLKSSRRRKRIAKNK